MSTLELNGKDFATQTSTAEPVLASTVTGGAGLSGSTSLGTVTVGTLGSGVVFPARHVIQRSVIRVARPTTSLYLTSGTGWVTHGDNASISFSFTPKSDDSTLILEYNYGKVHSSTDGGHGFYAFTKDGTGNRDSWEGGITDYNDAHGHFMTGMEGVAGLYQAYHGMLKVANTATTAFTIGLDVKRSGGNWYYCSSNNFHHLSVTEIQN